MKPSHPINNVVNRCLAASKLLGNGFVSCLSRCVDFPNFKNLLFCKRGLPMGFAFRFAKSSLFGGVLRVILEAASKNMAWINAWRLQADLILWATQ